MISCGIVGATGYTGVELLRILIQHPEVQIRCATSRSEAGIALADFFPSLRGMTNLEFTAPDHGLLAECDVVFFATPNGTAMKLVPALLDAGVKVIDLAADFRLKNASVWQQWYGMEHACPDLLESAIYGLPELNRESIKQAQLVANPGCYPTATVLALMPLLQQRLINADSIIADGKSGISGAGRGANAAMLAAETSESFKAYATAGHRHLPEIRQSLEIIHGGDVKLTFAPHLIPMIRGIHVTVYAGLTTQEADLQAVFESVYKNEPFVDVMPAGSQPETRSCKGSNMCRIAVHRPQDADTVVVLSVIDNLVKGAAGQAVQNMNLMLGLAETAGLQAVALSP